MYIKTYLDVLGSWKKTHVAVGCFLWKKIFKKHFVQLKAINVIDRKLIFPLGYLVLIMRLGARCTIVKIATRGTYSGS